jgi:hypothetical protein
MGVIEQIDFERYPRQGRHFNTPVQICFNYDSSRVIAGRIVRDDAEAPFLTIIQLADGRFVLATECQYSLDPLGNVARRAHGSPTAPSPVKATWRTEERRVSEPTKPALTPEEWKQAERSRKHSEMALLGYEGMVGVGRPQARAALALYGQIFGFTRDDLGVIHMLALQHHPTCRCDYCVTLKPKAESLMARIEALLPPEPFQAIVAEQEEERRHGNRPDPVTRPHSVGR